jgi:2'-5' RNA ligase
MENAAGQESEFLRLFFAIPFPEALQNLLEPILSAWSLSIPQVRWVRPCHLHITLRFLGRTPKTSLPLVTESLEQAARNQRAFWVSLGSIEAFPTRANPRVFWLSVDKGSSQTEELSRSLNQALALRGIPPEEARAFVAHVTLGRARSTLPGTALARVFSAALPADQMTFLADRLILYSSRLTGEGPLYTAVREVNLLLPESGARKP